MLTRSGSEMSEPVRFPRSCNNFLQKLRLSTFTVIIFATPAFANDREGLDPLYGRWRVTTEGPFGHGLIQIDIERDADGKPQVFFEGQTRRREPIQDAVVGKTGFSSKEYSGTLQPIKGLLRVNFRSQRTSEHQDTFLLFERDGPKFSEFDFARLDANGKPAKQYVYAPPQARINSDLQLASLQSVGLETPPLERAITEGVISGKYPRFNSLLIMKGGKLVVEEYFYGNNADFMMTMQSASKTFAGIAMGAAVRDGLIPSPDSRVIDLLPQYADTEWGRSRAPVSVRDLLTMRDVVDWDETTFSYDDPRNDHHASRALVKKLGNADGMIRHLFNKRYRKGRNNGATYMTGMSNTLGVVLIKRSGGSLQSYVQRKLLEPIGIGRSYWGRLFATSAAAEEGLETAGSTLHLTARDMAKFGQLMLNKGRWNDQQVIPTSWVVEATTVQTIMAPSHYGEFGYGYQTWIEKLSDGKRTIWTASANGSGGQLIYIVPTLDIIIVTNGTKYRDTPHYGGAGGSAASFVREKVIPALFGSEIPFKHQPFAPADIGYRVLP